MIFWSLCIYLAGAILAFPITWKAMEKQPQEKSSLDECVFLSLLGSWLIVIAYILDQIKAWWSNNVKP
ncbi:hypothetical protein [Spirosoma litoris]